MNRYQAIEESESALRKETIRLKEDIVAMENGMIVKIGDLKR